MNLKFRRQYFNASQILVHFHHFRWNHIWYMDLGESELGFWIQHLDPLMTKARVI